MKSDSTCESGSEKAQCRKLIIAACVGLCQAKNLLVPPTLRPSQSTSTTGLPVSIVAIYFYYSARPLKYLGFLQPCLVSVARRVED